MGEPKKSSPEPQSDDWRANIDNYGGENSERYFVLPLYFKLRKLQIGNRWKSQYVTMHREEVKKLKEYQNLLIDKTQINWVGSYISELEKREIII